MLSKYYGFPKNSLICAKVVKVLQYADNLGHVV